MMKYLKGSWLEFWGKVLGGFSFTIGMFWVYALLIAKSELTDEYMFEGAYMITLLGACFVGYLCAFQKKIKGWFFGAKGGGTFGLSLIGVNYSLNYFSLNWGKGFIFLTLTFIFGVIGGIIAVNRK